MHAKALPVCHYTLYCFIDCGFLLQHVMPKDPNPALPASTGHRRQEIVHVR